MKILKSWLNDYVDIKESGDEVADLLTFSGTLVESVETGLDDKIIVAKILEINPHPNADKLQKVIIDTGKGKLDVVCGANNIEVGQIVPLAMIGAKIGDSTIREAEIRGEKSFGMLCSEKELGLGEDHSGIKILPEEYKVGDSLNKYLGGDAVFDLEITPNRGDCLSHLGIAREYAVLTQQNIKFGPEDISAKNSSPLDFSVEIKNSDHCARYYAVILKNIKVGPSPEWLKDRLNKLGHSSINNVVDITNYIMLDLGQPLHAFDKKKLVGNKIIVRDAGEGEEIISIDGEKRILNSKMLVIADEKNPIAIAGVMGGAESEIDDKTTDIVLESAEFERKSIRKTAKDLGLSTEASFRFERGIDPLMVEGSADKAAKMIKDLCGGEIIGKVYDIAANYENGWIAVPYKKINDLLGTNISGDEMKNILTSLGFKFKDEMCQAPSWRHDVFVWQDLAEEVARIYGFSKIKLNPVPKTPAPKKSAHFIKEFIKDVLVEAGFSEVYGYPFLSEKDLSAIGLDKSDLLEVANPVQAENKFMRNSLMPGLLRAIAKNPAFDPVLIFEIGSVFSKEKEEFHLAVTASGKGAKKYLEEAISSISSKLNIEKNLFNISELKREDIARFKIKKPLTYFVELPIQKILASAKINVDEVEIDIKERPIHYRNVSRYPSIVRDLAFIVEENVDAQQIIDLMYGQSDLINRVELFDEFASDKFGAGKKNIAFHLDLQHQDRTLTDKEADEIVEKIVAEVKNKFSGEIRNY